MRHRTRTHDMEALLSKRSVYLQVLLLGACTVTATAVCEIWGQNQTPHHDVDVVYDIS